MTDMYFLFCVSCSRRSILPTIYCCAQREEAFAMRGARYKRGRQRSGDHRAGSKTAAGPVTPLDYALRILRDESKPDAIRVSVAKAALPYVYRRGDAGKPPAAEKRDEGVLEEKWSNLELARHIAHILGFVEDQLRARDLAEQVRDVGVYGMPVDNTDWAGILGRIMTILDACDQTQSLDRPGIRI